MLHIDPTFVILNPTGFFIERIFLYRNFMRALETEESLRKTLKAVQYLTNCYHFAIMRLIDGREVTMTLSAISTNQIECRIIHKIFIVRLFSAHIIE